MRDVANYDNMMTHIRLHTIIVITIIVIPDCNQSNYLGLITIIAIKIVCITEAFQSTYLHDFVA